MNTFVNRLVACLAVTWCVALFMAAPASGHAVLVTSAPANGALLQEAPDRIVLTYNEPVGPLAITLIDPDGQQYDLIEATTGGTDLAIALPPDLGDGTHVVSWRVMSTDGHPVGGVTAFSVRVVTGDATAGTVQKDIALVAAIWTSKTILYVALFFGVGGAVFAAVTAPPGPSLRLARIALGLGLVAAPLSLGLQGADVLALALSDLADPRPWVAGLSTSYGWTVAAALGALALAALSLRASNAWTIVLAVLALLVAPLSLIVSGHASSADPQWITRPALFLHIAGIVFWIGALLPLHGLLRHDTPVASGALVRFSRIVPYPVAGILISGGALAAIQLGPSPEHWLSAYGAILAGKLALLAILFGLALWNRLRLTQPVLEGNAAARHHLRNSIAAEAILVVIILGLVAGWRFTPPPRALAEAATPPISLHIHTQAVMADVTVTPARTGANTLTIFLMDGEFAPVTPLEVAAVVSAPQLGIEAARQPAEPRDDGFWHVSDLVFPVAGAWQLDLEIRLSRFELTRLTETFTIP